MVSQGRIFALLLAAVTIVLVVVGTVWPSPSAVAYVGGESLRSSTSTPEAVVENLGNDIRDEAWERRTPVSPTRQSSQSLNLYMT